MIRIGQLARDGGVSVAAIRFYEDKRLLRRPRRSPAGQRLYDNVAVESVKTIRQLQDMGFTLAEIREVLSTYLPTGKETSPEHERHSRECYEAVLPIGERKLAAFEAEITTLTQRRSRLVEILDWMRKQCEALPDRPRVKRRRTVPR